MEKWCGKHCVVTGASAGIGAAITVALADRGVHVIGLARRGDINDIAALTSKVSGKGTITPRACDVSDPRQISETFSWIEEQFGGVDVIVNNAGVVHHGQITDLGDHTLSEEEITSQIDVNIKGVVLCSGRAVASILNRGGHGHVVNINRKIFWILHACAIQAVIYFLNMLTKKNQQSKTCGAGPFVEGGLCSAVDIYSLAGHYVPFAPIMNVYSATKYAITAFTAALKEEVASFGGKIRVTSISPGLVKTDMANNSRIPEVREKTKKMRGLEPQDVADAVIYALSAPEHVNISEVTIQVIGEKRI